MCPAMTLPRLSQGRQRSVRSFKDGKKKNPMVSRATLGGVAVDPVPCRDGILGYKKEEAKKRSTSQKRVMEQKKIRWELPLLH